jgi:hypothetical protein
MKVKRNVFFFCLALISALGIGQDVQSDNELENNLIVNFVNPALEYEMVTGKSTILSGTFGVGYNGAYEELTITDGGFNYIIQPFIDIQYKLMYNRQKRERKNRIIHKNSCNFVSFRGIARGWSIADNVLLKSDDFDFAIGPTWGIQRSYDKFRFLVDIGPQYYFDTLGNNGFFPFMVQVNIGLNLSK